MTQSQQTSKKPAASALKLILFDIDGTLMITKGASSRCMKRAAEAIIGPGFEWHPITVGTLDPQIFDHLARVNGVEPTDAQREQYQSIYLDTLQAELQERQSDIVVLPGIEDLVQQLSERARTQGDLILGVLTGNFRRATQIKLELSGLGLERFPVIACADDGATRDDLPAVAMQKAEAITSRSITPEQVFILGDTPRDIQCAQANRCTPIAVATGRYTADQLRNAGSGVVFDTFADTDAVLGAMQIDRVKP